MTKKTLTDLLDELASIQAREVAEQSEGNLDVAAFAAYCTGVQFALELAMLAPNMARDLIAAIHADAPADVRCEWNRNASIFLKRVKELRAGG